MRWLFLLFIAVPLVEVYLLHSLARVIDFWPTVGLVLTTGMVGAWLARREGLRVWREWRDSLSTLAAPPRGVVDGVLVLVGASLLITPGVLTDALGILLLIPFTRRLVAVRLRAGLEKRLAGSTRMPSPPASASPMARGGVVETEGVDLGPRTAPRSPV